MPAAPPAEQPESSEQPAPREAAVAEAQPNHPLAISASTPTVTGAAAVESGAAAAERSAVFAGVDIDDEETAYALYDAASPPASARLAAGEQAAILQQSAVMRHPAAEVSAAGTSAAGALPEAPPPDRQQRSVVAERSAIVELPAEDVLAVSSAELSAADLIAVESAQRPQSGEGNAALANAAAHAASEAQTPLAKVEEQLADYAAMCARCSVFPEQVAETHRAFGVASFAARQQLDAAWQRRFGVEPQLLVMWQRLFSRCRGWLQTHTTLAGF